MYPLITRTGWPLWGDTLRAMDELQPDIVHIQYQSAAYGLHAAVNFLPWRLRLSRRRPRIVTTFHDLRFPYLFPKAGPLRHHAVLSLARGSDACVVTNPADWARLQAAGLGARLHPIPIGSNIRCEPPPGYERDRQRAKWGADHDTWLLAYFGFLNAGKGGETLIRCLAELIRAGRPARLLMVGGKIGASDPTNLAYLAKVEGLIAEQGLTERVQWTGFTASDEVSANLLATDCAVLPYREGASLRHGSLMAALAHGLPIVTTITLAPGSAASEAAAVFPTLVDGENALLVRPDDPVGMAAAVTRVMTEPVLRQRLAAGSAGLSTAFTWEVIARRHLELYSELMKIAGDARVSPLQAADAPPGTMAAPAVDPGGVCTPRLACGR